MSGGPSRQVRSVIKDGPNRKRKITVPLPVISKKFKCARPFHTNDNQIGVVSVSCTGDNYLGLKQLLTQKWQKLLCSHEDYPFVPLLKSEEFFRSNILGIMDGIDQCAENFVQWSKDDTNFFFNKFIEFVAKWKNQLVKEMKMTGATEGSFVKGKSMHDLAAHRFSLLNIIYPEALKFIKFSEPQKKNMEFKIGKLNTVISEWRESLKYVSSEASLQKELKSNEAELNQARKQADEYHKELKKMQDQLNEANKKSEESSLTTELKFKANELNEARKQAGQYCEELRKLQIRFTEADIKFKESSLATELKHRKEKREAEEQAEQYCEELRKLRDTIKEANAKCDDLTTQLENKNNELSEAKQQADQYFEELRKMQDSLNEAQLKLNNMVHINNPSNQDEKLVILDKLLQEKEKQLGELKRQLLSGTIRQMEQQSELIEAREQLKTAVEKSKETTQTQLKDTYKKLFEIRTMLLTKVPDYKSKHRIEKESFCKEEHIFQDVKDIIQFGVQAAKTSTSTEKNAGDSALEANSSSPRVSEYEMHLFTLVASLMKVTPFPVSTHFIYFCLSKIDNAVDRPFVEILLRKFPSIFKEVDVPGSKQKNWSYLDLKPVITI